MKNFLAVCGLCLLNKIMIIVYLFNTRLSYGGQEFDHGDQ